MEYFSTTFSSIFPQILARIRQPKARNLANYAILVSTARKMRCLTLDQLSAANVKKENSRTFLAQTLVSAVLPENLGELANVGLCSRLIALSLLCPPKISVNLSKSQDCLFLAMLRNPRRVA